MDFSVVITTYNRPDYLFHSLQSALEQTLQPKEIIVVDDNSSADYSDVLSKFNDPKLRYIKQCVSGGANVARNRGVTEAKYELVAFLDDDDIWLPHYLQEHKKKYDDGADAVVSGFKHLGDEKKIRVNTDNVVTKSSLVQGNKYCGMSGFSCKRDLIKELGFDEALGNGQDWDIYVRLYIGDYRFANIPSPIYLYRFQNLDGIGAKVRKLDPSNIESRLASAKKHRQFLGEKWYKRRIAQQYLYSLKHKSNKLSWVMNSLKQAGLTATVRFFYKKFMF